MYPGASAWVHKCVPRRRGLPIPGAGAWVHNVYPGAGAWVHIVYAGAGTWVHILAPFTPNVTRLLLNNTLILATNVKPAL